MRIGRHEPFRASSISSVSGFSFSAFVLTCRHIFSCSFSACRKCSNLLDQNSRTGQSVVRDAG